MASYVPQPHPVSALTLGKIARPRHPPQPSVARRPRSPPIQPLFRDPSRPGAIQAPTSRRFGPRFPGPGARPPPCGHRQSPVRPHFSATRSPTWRHPGPARRPFSPTFPRPRARPGVIQAPQPPVRPHFSAARRSSRRHPGAARRPFSPTFPRPGAPFRHPRC